MTKTMTEWRVILVDEFGDVESLDTFPTRNEAGQAMESGKYDAKVWKGSILTVEGMRDTNDEREFRRSGVVRGTPLAIHRQWMMRDDVWYVSGSEPDFASR